MLLVRDILPEARRILGECEESLLYSRISDATEILANKADFDPLIGWVDVSANDRRVTLPREVETILAMTISGNPSFPRDKWAEFHLNGAGSDCGGRCDYSWDDKGDYPTFRELSIPSRIVGSVENPADLTAELWAYGTGPDGRRIFSTVSGETVEGFQVPLFNGPHTVDPAAPQFLKITSVRKEPTLGFVTLSMADTSATVPYPVAEYEPLDTLPMFRRLVLSQAACWVRMQYRKKVFQIRRDTDRIPLHSKYGLLLMLKALQKLDEDRIDEADAYERKAVKYLTEEQFTRNPVTNSPIQVHAGPRIFGDRLD